MFSAPLRAGFSAATPGARHLPGTAVVVQPAGAATAAPSNPLVVPGAGTSKGQEVESLFVRDFFCQLLPC